MNRVSGEQAGSGGGFNILTTKTETGWRVELAGQTLVKPVETPTEREGIEQIKKQLHQFYLGN